MRRRVLVLCALVGCEERRPPPPTAPTIVFAPTVAVAGPQAPVGTTPGPAAPLASPPPPAAAKPATSAPGPATPPLPTDAPKGMDADAANRAWDEALPRFEGCIAKEALKGGAGTHRVDVSFQIVPSGRVIGTQWDGGGLGREVGVCLRDIVENLRFPPFSGDRAFPVARAITYEAVPSAAIPSTPAPAR